MNNKPTDNETTPPPSKRKRVRWALIGLLVAGLAWIGLDLFLMRNFSVSILGREARGFHITGQVVDEDGNAVPQAHVVVCVREAVVIPYSKDFGYGVVANSQGRFDVPLKVPFPVDRRLSVVAAGPGNLYGAKGIRDARKENGAWQANVIVQVLANTGFVDQARWRYDTFSPQREITFLGAAWKPVYDERLVIAPANP